MLKSKEKIIIANWKMKLSLAKTAKLAGEMKDKFKKWRGGPVAICPNFLSLSGVAEIIKGAPLFLGAQDVFWEETGAYTGEISPSLLLEAGCHYVIIGHSERRKYALDNYEMIHRKVKAVLTADGLTPIVCVGESEEERDTDRRDFVLSTQLNEALGGLQLLGEEKIIIAYEPIWAVGSGTAIEPAEAEYAHKIIALTLNEMFGLGTVKDHFRIIYGGSISSKNVKEFVGLENIDGLLVGGASLDAGEFYKIAKAIAA